MYTHHGGTYWMGPVGYDSTSTRYYCIEEAMPSTMRIGSVSPLPDSPQNRRLAALLHKYQHVHNSDYTQTALAIIMHDAFDTTTGAAGWAATRETLQQYPQLFKRVDELLAEAPLLVPETMAMELEYDDVARTGAVRLRIHNSDGNPVSGIPFTLTIDGPARFGHGSATVSGTSGEYTTVITWHATGDGPVTVSGSVTLPSIDRIISSQDMVALGSGYVQALDEVTVPVRTTFNPTISTRTSPKSIDTGAPVTDDVQVSALPGSGAWPRGAQVHARGWYFGGLPVSALGNGMCQTRTPPLLSSSNSWRAPGTSRARSPKPRSAPAGRRCMCRACASPGRTSHTSPNRAGSAHGSGRSNAIGRPETCANCSWTT